MPLAVRGEVIGELSIIEPLEIVEARQITEAIAQRLSAHIENLRLTEQTQVSLAETNKRAVELEAVAEVTTAASTILERDRLLASAAHLTQSRSVCIIAMSSSLITSPTTWASSPAAGATKNH